MYKLYPLDSYDDPLGLVMDFVKVQGNPVYLYTDFETLSVVVSKEPLNKERLQAILNPTD